MRARKIFLLIVVSNLILVISTILILKPGRSLAFVDIGRLQAGYKLKDNLEQRMKGTLLTMKNRLDSLNLIKNLERDPVRLSVIDTLIRSTEYDFNNLYRRADAMISEELWKKLNPLLDKYGKDHNYDIIIGANGAGTVMYGNKEADITEDIIKYVNKYYAIN